MHVGTGFSKLTIEYKLLLITNSFKSNLRKFIFTVNYYSVNGVFNRKKKNKNMSS